MRSIVRGLIVILLSSGMGYSESFFVLSGVKSYNPIVVNSIEKIDKGVIQELKETLIKLSIDAGVKIDKNDSRVLALVIKRFSLGTTIGINLELLLAEYVYRKGSKEEVFGISYKESKTFLFDEDFEDTLEESAEEMIEKFMHQYQEDNKRVSKKKKTVTHENFAEVMRYETDYHKALMRAKKEKKPLFIFMTTTYCPWCRKLENRILVEENIDKKIKDKFIPVMLNFDKKNFPKSLQNIAFTPTLYIMNEKNETIEDTFIGYSSRDRFLDILK